MLSVAEQILFWSTGPEEFRFLSNFHMCQIKAAHDFVWPSAEHLFFGISAEFSADQDKIRLHIKHPAEAKKYARTIPKVDDWNEIKDATMLYISRLKFEQNDDLKEMLLMTDGFELVHFAPWGDVYWGVNKEMKGENRQGKILMQVREELRQR